MKLDLKQYIKTHEDPKSIKLQHSDGHEMTIAKAHLSPKMKGHFASMPIKLADGGEVPEMLKRPEVPDYLAPNESVSPQSSFQSPPQQDLMPKYDMQPEPERSHGFRGILNRPIGEAASDLYDMGKAAYNMLPDANSTPLESIKNYFNKDEKKPELNQPTQDKLFQGITSPETGIKKVADVGPAVPPQQPEQMPNMDQFGDQAYLHAMQSGMGKEAAAQMMNAQSMANLGAQQAGIYKEQMKKLQGVEDTYQNTRASLMQERQNLIKDINDGHIDPDRYIKNMSTGSRIMAGIGMILAGASAGMHGGPNAVAKMLDDAIHRDIESQKHDLGKKNTLLQENMNQLQDARQAQTQTAIQLGTITEMKLRQAAAQAQNPAVKAQLMQIAGQYEQRMGELNHKFAQDRAIGHAMATGAFTPEIIQRLPKEYQKNVVQLPNGKYDIAYDEKGAQELRGEIGSVKPIMNNLDRLDAIGSKALTDPKARAQVDSIRQLLVPQIMNLEGFKRLTEMDKELFQKTFRDPNSFVEAITGSGKFRSDALRNMITDSIMGKLSTQTMGGFQKYNNPQMSQFGGTQQINFRRIK